MAASLYKRKAITNVKMSQPVRLRGEEPLPIMVGALFPFLVTFPR